MENNPFKIAFRNNFDSEIEGKVVTEQIAYDKTEAVSFLDIAIKNKTDIPIITEAFPEFGYDEHESHKERVLYFKVVEGQRKPIEKNEIRIRDIQSNENFLRMWTEKFSSGEIKIDYFDEGLFEIPVSLELLEALPIPVLPEGYGYKGGVARAVLACVLGFDFDRPRDLDLVYLGDKEKEDVNLTNKMSEDYMPDDYKNGYGVEYLEPDYFDSRDFTVNEVIFTGKNIIATQQCILDIQRNIVRFTEYEKEESYRGDTFFIKPKLLAKAIRFVAETNNKALSYKLASETDELCEAFVDEFHAALHLDRALEQGRGPAQNYVDTMVEKGFLPEEIYSVEDAFEYLIGQTDFIFRNCPESIIENENNFIDEIFSENILKLSENTPTGKVSLNFK